MFLYSLPVVDSRWEGGSHQDQVNFEVPDSTGRFGGRDQHHFPDACDSQR